MDIYQVLDKREDWNFVDLGEVKIEAITKEVIDFHDEWLINTNRQETFETHQNTFVFEMMSLDYAHGLSSPGICYVKKGFQTEAAADEIKKIYRLLEQAVGGKIVRSEVVSMLPNSRVRTHKDRSDLLYVSRRFHIPIKTNSDVVFITGNEHKNLESGKLYELNNIKYHSVHNNSPENRIHLIIDVLPNKYSCNLEYEYET